ncbi:hypothetical protein TNCV_1831061 [Trichonephila clavipes]|nr:hypothetical protein TNCV_1831061 [Trichonephila clavipes]
MGDVKMTSLQGHFPDKNLYSLWTVGNLAVRASDSRPEGMGSMPDVTTYPPSTHGFHAKIVEAEIGGVTIYRPFGEFRRANWYCHLYGAQGQRQAYLAPCHDEFRGPRSDYVRQVTLAATTATIYSLTHQRLGQ